MTQHPKHQHTSNQQLMQLRPMLTQQELLAEIARLRVERNAVILAHNYQRAEVQAIADYVGDSLGLSRQAATTDAEVIVFAGVHFMAETAAILNPTKTVLLPDANAGCSLADTLTGNDVLAWRAQNPGGLVVVYVNTTAEVKAEADYCVTSGNAVQIVASLPPDVPVLFAPDRFLAAHVERQTGRKLDIWQGACHVHEGILPEHVDAARAEHPDAELLIHPECGCTSHVLAQFPEMPLYSTEGMVHRAQSSAAQEFVVITELGMVHRLEHDVPEKTFYPVTSTACCEYMKMTNLENIHEALRDMTVRITVAPEVAARALKPIERMLSMG